MAIAEREAKEHRNTDEDGYSRSMDMITEAARSARAEGIGLPDFIAALLDFTAALALSKGGQQASMRFLTRLQGRRVIEQREAHPARKSAIRDRDAGQEELE